MVAADLPAGTVRQLDAMVESLDGLEVVVRVCRDPARTWTHERLASELAVPVRVVRRTMARMLASGLVRTVGASVGTATEYSVASERVELAGAIAHLHATRRIELINHIASRALQRIQAIADSFRIRSARRVEATNGGEADDPSESGDEALSVLGVAEPAR